MSALKAALLTRDRVTAGTGKLQPETGMASPEQDSCWDKGNKSRQSLYQASVFPLVHTEHYRPVSVVLS